MGSSTSMMRAAILLAVVAVATGAPKLSKKGLSTPLARGGGKIVGGTEAYPGEFPPPDCAPPWRYWWISDVRWISCCREHGCYRWSLLRWTIRQQAGNPCGQPPPL